MHDVLHWLPISQRIFYRIAALVWRGLIGCGPSYLTDLWRSVLDLASRQVLHSSAHGELLALWTRSALKHHTAFSVIGPPIGLNSLLCCTCCPGTMCLPSARFLRHFSLVVGGQRVPLSRFLEGAL